MTPWGRLVRRRGIVLTVLLVGLCCNAPDARAVSSDSAAPAGQVTVAVLLEVQADFGSIRASNRRDRIVKIVRALRSTATTQQAALLAFLRTRQSQHEVSSFTPLWLANEVVVTATPSVVAEITARSDVRAVRPERTIQAPQRAASVSVAGIDQVAATTAATAAAAEQGLDKVEAPALWGQGYLGQGVVVASLDTGVDVTHPDLSGRWRGGLNSWFDPYGEHPATPTDISGHGTQTMGVIVGGSAGGTAIGMAPNASWIAAKIFNDRGVATTTAIHQAFQWVLDPDDNPATADAPAVVNNSWDDQTTACSAEFQPDLAALRAAGIVPVFAAGNSGPMSGSVLNPANLAEALSVGGTDGSDVIEPSSSRGPSSCGQALSPTMTAPDTAVRTTDLYGGYVVATGTSLAAPHVSGALALLLSAAPTLTGDQMQAAILDGAVDLGATGPDPTYGEGRLDALAAYRSVAPAPDFTVTPGPASVSVAPGGTATYSVDIAAANGFSGDVSLTLSGLDPSLAGWSFQPAVVPLGSGSSTLTVSTGTLPPGTYPLTVTATSGLLSHSGLVSLVVSAPPDFTIAAAPDSVSATAGSAAHVTLTVGPVNGFGGAVDLGVSGLPTAVGTATLTPARITTSGPADLALATNTGAPPGSYQLTVTATSGSTTHTVSVTLTVRPAATRDFAITVNPSTRTVLRGQATAYLISVSALGGFTGRVKLVHGVLPPGTIASWLSKTVTAPGTATLRVRTSAGTPRGTYRVAVIGWSGPLSHQVVLTLVVR